MDAALRAATRVHCVGVAGSGMNSMALLLRAMDKQVSGSDLGGGPTLEKLRQAGVRVHQGHLAQHLQDAELVIRSAAVGQDNPEVAEALRRGIAVLTHAQALGALMRERIGLAVAGTHGKTTTTAMLAWVLAVAGLDPSLALGGEAIDFDASARLGRGPHLVAEADEFGRRFLQLSPRLAIVTNVEADHLDYYHDLDEIVEAFRVFASRVHPDGVLITCADAPLLDALDLPATRLRYGRAAHADWRIESYRARPGGGCDFELRATHGALERYQLVLSGEHNALNATAVVAAARWVGVDAKRTAEALGTFHGTRRRFETKGVIGGITVMDDYAHHPTELLATLAAARGAHSGRILAVFQPHTSNRTANLLDAFTTAFGDADRVLLLPIYHPAGREPETLAIRSEDLAATMADVQVEVASSLDDAVERLLTIAQPGDLVLTMGAGDVNLIGDRLLARLTSGGRA